MFTDNYMFKVGKNYSCQHLNHFETFSKGQSNAANFDLIETKLVQLAEFGHSRTYVMP